MIGLHHSAALGVTLVIVRDGTMDGVTPAYRAILPGGVRSVLMSDQSMATALIINGYQKIGGK